MPDPTLRRHRAALRSERPFDLLVSEVPEVTTRIEVADQFVVPAPVRNQAETTIAV